jgi:beta-carotene 3-hydroxylase
MGFSWILVFLLSFGFMEWAAWFCHKYVMHGFLWSLHEDHHIITKEKVFQKNDAFALFFATPSFLTILFDHLYNIPLLGAVGFGIMAYGAAYFFVHEVIIHRRLKFIQVRNSAYVRALNAAHKVHHSIYTKEGSRNFGMLVVSREYFGLKQSRPIQGSEQS